jgi:hypothetical protein
MNIRKVLLALVMAAASAPVLAAVDWMPIDRKIVTIFVYEEMVLVKVSPTFNNTQGCSKGGNDTVMIRTVNNAENEKMSALLAAASADRQVGLALSGCGGGNFDYPLIYRVAIEF